MARKLVSNLTNAPLVTSLPTVSEATEVFLEVDTAGTYGGPYVWRCFYRPATAGAYKWHVVDGPQLVIEKTHVGTNWSILSTTPVATTGAGTLPNITLPFAGDWDITVYASEMYLANTAAAYAFLSFSVGATEASRNDSATIYGIDGTSQPLGYIERTTRKNGIAAGTLIQMKGWSTASTLYVVNTLNGLPMGLKAKPVRIG